MASNSIAPGGGLPKVPGEARSSLPPPANLPALRQRWVEEGWAQEARYERLLGAIAIVGILFGWAVDYHAMGASAKAFALLAVRALAAGTAVPLVIATFAATPPRWLARRSCCSSGGSRRCSSSSSRCTRRT